jgi:hypothetical protein
VGFTFLTIWMVLCVVTPRTALSQRVEIAALSGTAEAANIPAETRHGSASDIQDKPAVESEIAVMGMIPFTDVRLYSATVRCDAWTIGVEYDRHSWGYLLGARVDYVAEVIPFMLLSEPAAADFWGNPKSPYQQLLPGVSILPIGFRFLWRSHKAVKPYMVGKFGGAFFTQKAMSPAASYANFNTQAAFGMQIRVSDRVDLRIEPFQFFHVSNGYLAASNPGMDELAARFGMAYHLGRRGH